MMIDLSRDEFSVVINDGETIESIVARMCENYKRVSEGNCRVIMSAIEEMMKRREV